MKRCTRRIAAVTIGAVALGVAALGPSPLTAQGMVTITGHIADSAGAPLPAAMVHLVGTQLGAAGAGNGEYRIANVPPGTYRILAVARGYAADTESVNVTSGTTVEQNFHLRVNVTQLAQIVVSASPRLAETKGSALDSMRVARNIKYVESGDDIRSLPSLNAAEAAERIPGVSTERDEGEGKFVQIRGTEP
ncbi:MAG: carboxypeptidase regulatory-like domain-containing protein [Gemmatimonadales bacterium]